MAKLLLYLTLSQTTNFRLVQELPDDNFKFDKNGKKGVENIVGKGEIAHDDQFLLFPHSIFKRLVLQTRKNQGLFGRRLKYLLMQ